MFLGLNQPFLVAEMVYKTHKEPILLGKTVWQTGTTRQHLLDVALGRIKNDPCLLANFERSRLELRLLELSVSVDGQQQPPQSIRDDDSLLANFLDLLEWQRAGKLLKLHLSVIPMLAVHNSTQPNHQIILKTRMHPSALKHSMDRARQLGLGVQCQQQSKNQQQVQSQREQQSQEHRQQQQQQQFGGTAGNVHDGLSGAASDAAAPAVAAAAGGATPENDTGYKAVACECRRHPRQPHRSHLVDSAQQWHSDRMACKWSDV